MTLSEIIDLINLIERKVPVYSIKIRNTYVWPLVRLRLGYYIIETQKNDRMRGLQVAIPLQNHNVVSLRSALSHLFRSFFANKKKVNQKFVSTPITYPLTENQNEILLFSYAVNCSIIDNERVNIYIDPLSKILDAFQQRYSYESLNFFGGESLGLKDEFSDFYSSFLSSKESQGLTVHEEKLVNKLQSKISSLLPLSLPAHFCLSCVSQHFLYTGAFKNYLSEKYPNLKLLFFYDWPNPVGLAVHHACAELNITSIEIQHGQSLDEDFCTARWVNLPKSNVDFFPKIFWEFDDESSKRINEWIPERSQAIVGGKLDVGSFHFNGTETNRKYILVSLQNDALPTFFVDFVKTNSHLEWMFRIHPRHTYMKKWVEENFEGFSTIIDEGSRPIHYSFNQSFLHCTLSSGSAIDALYFGLTSIILNEDGYLSFRQYIESGEMFFCESYEALQHLFSENLDKWKKVKKNELDLVNKNLGMNKKAVENILKTHL